MSPAGEVWVLAGAGFTAAGFSYGAAIAMYLDRWSLARYCLYGAFSVLFGTILALS